MNKTFLWIIGIVVVALAAFVLLGERGTDGTPSDGINTELSSYFQERMITLGVENVGQPIEGFDANLLIMAYPGLEPRDFEGVEAFEGSYETEGGEAVFVREQAMPVTSAESTVSDEGYATLLANVSERLDISIENEADVDALIERINTGSR